MDINACTDPIKAEAAKLNPRFGLQLKSRKLAQLIKEVNGMVGGYAGFIDKEGARIQVMLNSLLDINSRPNLAKVDSVDFPFRASVKIGGIEYYSIFSLAEWLKFANDNQLCSTCGKDFAEYMDYDQNVEKMYFGCRECRNGEAIERAV